MDFDRSIYPNVLSSLNRGRAIILYGPRRVGKTTLLQKLLREFPEARYLNCDEPDVRDALNNRNSSDLKRLFGKTKLILIDEAQRVPSIGITLKLIVDILKEVQVVATGSSSFELSKGVREPLTGRSFEYLLLPISVFELSKKFDELEVKRMLEDMLIYGNYPTIRLDLVEKKEDELQKLANDYVYKDILQLERIKYPEKLEKLMRALAHQIGSEASYNELAGLCELSKDTVQEYLRILEQAFIIFKLEPYSSNLRNSLKKMRKIYFWDLGIRNALIKDFRPLSLRSDQGALFENFFISEYKKNQILNDPLSTLYFWRDYQGHELDLIIEKAGSLKGIECKWTYGKSDILVKGNAPTKMAKVCTKENYLHFLLQDL